jgi:hypothetical protein
MVDHDPRRLLASVFGREDRSGAFAAVSLRILGVPTIGPNALALGREELQGLLDRKVDGDLGGAKHSSSHARNHHAVRYLVGADFRDFLGSSAGLGGRSGRDLS